MAEIKPCSKYLKWKRKKELIQLAWAIPLAFVIAYIIFKVVVGL